MINILFSREKNGFLMIIKGHSEYAKKGEPDIVCSAVSILGFSVLKVLDILSENGYEIDIKTVKYKSGYMEADFEIRKENSKLLDAMSAFFVGFDLLAKTYPDNVKLDTDFVPFFYGGKV